MNDDNHEAAINLIHPEANLKFVAEQRLLDIRVRIYRSSTGNHFYTIEMAASPAITLYPLSTMFALTKVLDRMGDQMTVFVESGEPSEESLEPKEVGAENE